MRGLRKTDCSVTTLVSLNEPGKLRVEAVTAGRLSKACPDVSGAASA